MKRSTAVCLVIVCCLLASAPALADTCDDRFGGSCRSESTTTIVRIKGEPAVPDSRRSRVSRIKQSRTEKSQRRAKRQLARSAPAAQTKRLSEPVVVTSVSAASNPTRIVDEGFNTLAADEYLDPLLEEALMKVRQQMLGAALP